MHNRVLRPPSRPLPRVPYTVDLNADYHLTKSPPPQLVRPSMDPTLVGVQSQFGARGWMTDSSIRVYGHVRERLMCLIC